MSDTDTRSVAEIIGWRTERFMCNPPRIAGYHRPDGSITKEPPTPDDMLAWLKASQRHVSRLTLHAALEAAVRAVAGEES